VPSNDVCFLDPYISQPKEMQIRHILRFKLFKEPSYPTEKVIGFLDWALNQIITEKKRPSATTHIPREIKWVDSTDKLNIFQLNVVWQQPEGVWLYKQIAVRTLRRQ
jgi:hypothetical protein